MNVTGEHMYFVSDSQIDIRGTGTIGEGSSSAPLVLIDGTPGDLNMINMQDVENMAPFTLYLYSFMMILFLIRL